MTGWHLSNVFADAPVDRPTLPEWLTVQRTFDEWLVSTPDAADAVTADDETLSPEQLDIMIAYGWKDVDDD